MSDGVVRSVYAADLFAATYRFNMYGIVPNRPASVRQVGGFDHVKGQCFGWDAVCSVDKKPGE